MGLQDIIFRNRKKKRQDMKVISMSMNGKKGRPEGHMIKSQEWSH